jgi:hypothetical protein
MSIWKKRTGLQNTLSTDFPSFAECRMRAAITFFFPDTAQQLKTSA